MMSGRYITLPASAFEGRGRPKNHGGSLFGINVMPRVCRYSTSSSVLSLCAERFAVVSCPPPDTQQFWCLALFLPVKAQMSMDPAQQTIDTKSEQVGTCLPHDPMSRIPGKNNVARPDSMFNLWAKVKSLSRKLWQQKGTYLDTKSLQKKLS